MSDSPNYAIFFFPQAIEALGAPIKPYLRESAGGQHIVCTEIDASGPFFGMTLIGSGKAGEPLKLEIMVPSSMVRLVMSMHGAHDIGFI